MVIYVMYVTWKHANLVHSARITHNREYVYTSYETAIRDFVVANSSPLVMFVQLCEEVG